MVFERQYCTDYKKYWLGPDYRFEFSYYYKPISTRLYHYDDYWPYDWHSWRYWPSWRSYYKYYMNDSIPSYKVRSYWPNWRFWHYIDEKGYFKNKTYQSSWAKYTSPSIRYKYNIF